MRNGVLTEDHPLYQKSVYDLVAWKQWLEHWQKEKFLPNLLGLLHVGFDIPVHGDEGNERIKFYLTLANGFLDPLVAERPEQWYVKSDAKIRRELQEKAWKVLVHKLFQDQKDKREYHDLPSWFPHSHSDETYFHAVVSFFTRSEGYSNIPTSYNTTKPENRIAREFLVQFVRFAMEVPDHHGVPMHQITLRCRKVQPALLKIMGGLGILGEAWQYKLTSAATRQLESMATKGGGSVGRALLNGYASANALILLRAKRRAQAGELREKRAERQSNRKSQRTREIERAKEQVKTAQENLEKLKRA